MPERAAAGVCGHPVVPKRNDEPNPVPGLRLGSHKQFRARRSHVRTRKTALPTVLANPYVLLTSPGLARVRISQRGRRLSNVGGTWIALNLMFVLGLAVHVDHKQTARQPRSLSLYMLAYLPTST